MTIEQKLRLLSLYPLLRAKLLSGRDGEGDAVCTVLSRIELASLAMLLYCDPHFKDLQVPALFLKQLKKKRVLRL